MSAILHGVIPAAGIGSRMGSATPKQYLRINGSTLLELSVQALLRVPGMRSVTVALHPDDSYAAGLPVLRDERVQLVTGGAERADSVLAALREVRGGVDDWVLVHDAARPGLRLADVERLIARVVASGEGGILAEPVMDTVKLADEQGRVETTLDRSRLWRAQTPQMFPLGQLIAALELAAEGAHTVTDESSAMEAAGYPVHLVAGSASNLKVTLPADLELAAWYLASQGESS